MDAVPAIDTRDLGGYAFACLADCGFCCTMQPEVEARDVAALSARLGRPVPVSFGDDRTYLRLQNSCGACTLLQRRECTQYDLRPAHCRFFPYHLYFGDTAEAYLNYTCRGVEQRAGVELSREFQITVVDASDAARIAREAAEARAVYAEFRGRAEAAGAWQDPAPLVADARANAASLFTRAGIEAAAKRTGDDVSAADLAAMALESWENPRPESRPYYLDRKLRWLTFTRRGRGGLKPAEMDERGEFTPAGELVDGLDRWTDAPPALADALGRVMSERLLARGIFVGGVYARVDDLDYEGTVGEALHARLAEIASALLLRARLVAALEPTIADDARALADEAHRFYDTEFLDQGTIGGFL